MSSSPLPPDVNELVARACGFTRIGKMTPPLVEEWYHGARAFEPSKDVGAAVRALEAWAKKNRVLVTLRCSGMLNGVWTCCVSKEPDTIPIYENECEAICAMVLAAEEPRT